MKLLNKWALHALEWQGLRLKAGQHELTRFRSLVLALFRRKNEGSENGIEKETFKLIVSCGVGGCNDTSK